MRTLRFKVSGQKIEKDPDCDFKDISPGSVGYLKAQFSFDSEWTGLFKAAEFRVGNNDTPYPVLITDGECMVPSEVTDGRVWSVCVIGKRGSIKLPTNKVSVRQEG